MLIITTIGEINHEQIKEYLEKRNIFLQYKKAKEYIIKGQRTSTFLHQKQPKTLDEEKQVWYFRINKKYRALCKKRDTTLVVFAIDDHQ